MQLGGIGFVHYNNSVEEQVAQVKRAKRHQAGIADTPEVLAEDSTLADIHALKVWYLVQLSARSTLSGQQARVHCCVQIMEMLKRPVTYRMRDQCCRLHAQGVVSVIGQ